MERHKPNTKEMEQMIWEFLKTSAQPIKAKVLAERLQISERMVRRLIRDLIAQGYQVASSMEAPYGYFIPKNEHERRRYRNQLISRLKHIAGRLRDFDKAMAEKIEQILMMYS
jgi:biotin operon repressor